MPLAKLTIKLSLLIVAFCTLLLYVQKIDNEFVFDDYAFVLGDPSHTDIKNIPGFFVTDQSLLYRPLRATAYTVVYSLYGHSSKAHHLVTLFFHLAVTLIFTIIVYQLSGKAFPALIAGLIAGIHPIHSGRALWITSGFDLFGTIFGYGALAVFLAFQKRGGAGLFVAFILLLTAGLAGSEEMVTVPLLMLLFFIAKKDWGEKKRFALSFLMASFLTFSYLVVRKMIIPGFSRVDQYTAGGLYETVLTMLVAFCRYIGLAFFPIGLAPARSVTIYSQVLWAPLLAFIFLAIFAFSGVIARKKSPMVFVAVGWFFIGLAPFSNLIPLQTLFAERYFYAGFFGFAILFALLLTWIMEKGKGRTKYPAVIFTTLLFGVFFFLSSERIAVWHDSESLWKDAIKNDPETYLANLNWGSIVYKEDKEKGLIYLRKANKIRPTGHEVKVSFGNHHVSIGEVEKGLEYFHQSLKLRPGHTPAMEGAMQAMSLLKNYNDAWKMANSVLERNPNNLVSLKTKSYILVSLGRCDPARDIIESIKHRMTTPEQREMINSMIALCQMEANSETK